MSEESTAVPSKKEALTLVVPTFNRHSYLSRLLNYYACAGTDVSILVLDSSEPTVLDSNRQLIERLGDRFTHRAFSSTLPVAAKLCQGLTEVGTKYCAFCADDDLVFLDGLRQARLYLESDASCVCVDGIYLNFFRSGNDIQLKIEYASKGIDAEHPGARVFRLYQKYESLFYGVFRTSDLTEIFAGVTRNPSLHFQELFQATAALLIGKSHRLPVFYAGRQHCDPAEPTRDKWQTYYWFADNREEFLEHYVRYRDELWTFYEKRGAEPRLAREAFFKSMDLAHAVFFGTGCPPAYLYSVLQSQWPNDPFKEPDTEEDDICNQLSGSLVRLWGVRFAKGMTTWLKEVSAHHGASRLKRLNRVIQKQFRTPWNCALAPEVRWLANDKQFLGAYLELCRYLDRS